MRKGLLWRILQTNGEYSLVSQPFVFPDGDELLSTPSVSIQAGQISCQQFLKKKGESVEYHCATSIHENKSLSE